MKFTEKWGDSVEIAVNLALQDLKLTKEQVKVTVLEEPSRGFLGIGAKLAKVRVEELVPEKPAKKPEKVEKREKVQPKEEKASSKEDKKAAEAVGGTEAEKPKHKNKKKKKNTDKKENSKEINNVELNLESDPVLVSKKPDDLVEVEEHKAKDFLNQMAKEMGIEIETKVFTNKDSVYIDVEGKDTGTVIGKRGATLDAVQYLTSLVVNKGEQKYIRVVVDAEGYRAKREATLEKLALRLAEKAVKTGRNVRLEPMNPYERKVIHSTLQAVPSVVTKSEGEEPYRKVVILPARK